MDAALTDACARPATDPSAVERRADGGRADRKRHVTGESCGIAGARRSGTGLRCARRHRARSAGRAERDRRRADRRSGANQTRHTVVGHDSADDPVVRHRRDDEDHRHRARRARAGLHQHARSVERHRQTLRRAGRNAVPEPLDVHSPDHHTGRPAGILHRLAARGDGGVDRSGRGRANQCRKRSRIHDGAGGSVRPNRRDLRGPRRVGLFGWLADSLVRALERRTLGWRRTLAR